MTVVISPNITRTKDSKDFKTGKNIRTIFHPNGKVEKWECDGSYNPIRQIQ